MDVEERAQFKTMFRTCVLLLNAFSITCAIGLCFVIIPPVMGKAAVWTWVVAAVFFVLFGISLYFFIRKYKSTKAWLDIHGTTRAERKAKEAADLETQRLKIRREMFEEACDDLKKEIGELTVRSAACENEPDRAAVQKEIEQKLAELKGYQDKLKELEKTHA
ncbi:MAG TPA: DUF308 domain-containing protein [Methanocorpusculum sp.]|nr:DUF308 domain-containing protein [Methanocorpusculum sp.]